MARQMSTVHCGRAPSFGDVETDESVNYRLSYSLSEFSIDEELVDIVSVYSAVFARSLLAKDRTHGWTTELVAKQYRKVNHIVIELDSLDSHEFLDKLQSATNSPRRPKIFIGYDMGNVILQKALLAAMVATPSISALLQPETVKAVIYHETKSFATITAPFHNGFLDDLFQESSYSMLSSLATNMSSIGTRFPMLYFQDQRNTQGSKDLRKIAEVFTIPVLLDADCSPVGQVSRKRVEFEIQKTFSGASSLKDTGTVAEADHIQRWLQPDQPMLDLDKRHAHQGTFQWLPKLDAYKSWLGDGNERVFWISGKAGSGKSTLCTFVAESLRSKATEVALTAAVCNVFCVRSWSERRDPLNLLLSTLLYQALTNLPSSFTKLKGCAKPVSDLSTEDLLGHLSEALSAAQDAARPPYIILDGLDELDVDEGRMRDFLKWLLMLFDQPQDSARRSNSTHQSRGARILITSRPWPIFEEAFNKIPKIRLEDHTRQDIFRYVNDKFSDSIEPAIMRRNGDLASLATCPEKDVVSDIRSMIVRKASGMFLWVDLVVEMLKTELLNPQKVQESLVTLPPDTLDGVYEHIFAKISSSHDRERALKIIKWVTFARRPMTPDELGVALTFDQSPGTSSSWTDRPPLNARTDFSLALDCCRGLVTTRSRNVQLLHESVRDFLANRNFRDLMINSLVVADVAGGLHGSLAVACLAYLSLNSGRFLETQARKDDYPLVNYAASCWTDHMCFANDDATSQEYLLNTFYHSQTADISRWLQLRRSIKEGRIASFKRTTLLHVASRHGWSKVLQQILRDSSSLEALNQKDDYGTTPLHLALLSGQAETVRLLLDCGADVTTTNQYGHNPLMIAASRGHGSIVEALLRDSREKPHVGIVWTASAISSALLLAVIAGQSQIVNYLLVNSSKRASAIIAKSNALVYAVSRNHSHIVRLLLESGADPDAKDPRFGQRALSLAVACKNELVVSWLLAFGADPNLGDEETGDPPLAHAIRLGCASVVRLLIREGASVNHLLRLNNIKPESWATRILNGIVNGALGDVTVVCCGSGTSSTESVAGTPPPGGPSKINNKAGNKRDRDDEKPQDRNNENSGDQKRSRGSDDQTKPATMDKDLACPFAVRYPELYTCSVYASVHRLKEHIYQKHRAHLCVICWKSYSSQAEERRHRVEVGRGQQTCIECQRSDYSQGIVEDQAEKLRSRTGLKGLTIVEGWNRVWNIIFPDMMDQCPSSSYRTEMDRRQFEHVMARVQPLLRPEVSQEQVRHALGSNTHASAAPAADPGVGSPPLTAAALRSVLPMTQQQDFPTIPIPRLLSQRLPYDDANTTPIDNIDGNAFELPFLPNLANKNSVSQQHRDSGIGTDMSSDKPPASNSGQVETPQQNFASSAVFGAGSLLDQQQSEYFTADGSDIFMVQSDMFPPEEDPYAGFMQRNYDNM